MNEQNLLKQMKGADMLKQEGLKMRKTYRNCQSCGILRDDCKRSSEKLWICATCATGAMPKSEACKEGIHKSCKTEACYCECHPENNG